MPAIPRSGIATRPARAWLRRAGAAGFLFFLIKGLAWLAVPAAIGVLNLLASLH